MLDIISLRKKWVFFILEPGMLLGACKPDSQAHIDSRTERVKSLGKVRNEMKCVLSIIESYSIEKNGSKFSHLLCCYCNFWMPKKSQNSTIFLKSSSIHC